MEGSIVRSPFWPEHSAHRDFWERHNCAHVYEYDPTDDGPETVTCRAVFSNYSVLDLNDERLVTHGLHAFDIEGANAL